MSSPMHLQSGRFEVWFLSDDRISVLVETSQEDGDIFAREILEVTVFAGFAAGIIGSAGKLNTWQLCERLAKFQLPESRDDIPTTVDGLDLVMPGTERGRKGFEGAFKIEWLVPIGRMKTHGFSFFRNRDLLQSGETATIAMLLDLALGFSPPGRAALVRTAHLLGIAGGAGQIRLRNHHQVASAAVDAAFEPSDDANETS